MVGYGCMSFPVSVRGLPPPTGEDIRVALVRLMGQERGNECFRALLRDAGLGGDNAAAVLSNDVQEVCRLARLLAEHHGMQSLVGLSIQIRCETYLALLSAGSGGT